MYHLTTRRLLAALAVLAAAAVLGVVLVAAAAPPTKASSLPTPKASATPPLRVLIKGGSTTLVTDPGQSEVLFGGGVSPLALAPAGLQLTDDAFRFSFPIGSGDLNPVSLHGTFGSRGGFAFWGRQTMSAWTVLSFTKLRATLGATSIVTAVFNTDQGRHRIMSLDLTHEHVVHFTKGGHAWVRISHIGATMSDWLVSQLTTAFGGYHPATHTLGTIAISARLN
jgi:hypothetical protein